MSLGFVPVDDATPVLRVDLHVGRAVRGASVGDSTRPDSREDAVELALGKREVVEIDALGLDAIGEHVGLDPLAQVLDLALVGVGDHHAAAELASEEDFPVDPSKWNMLELVK